VQEIDFDDASRRKCFRTPGDVWHIESTRLSCEAYRARHQSCSAKVSGTNLREGRRDEILVVASRRAFDQNSTRRAINELAVSRRRRRHRAAAVSRSIVDDAESLETRQE
jgi:hypothetical protein